MSVIKLRDDLGSERTAAVEACDGVVVGRGLVVLTSGMFMRGLGCVKCEAAPAWSGPQVLRLRYA
jgi:hypothetical protein